MASLFLNLNVIIFLISAALLILEFQFVFSSEIELSTKVSPRTRIPLHYHLFTLQSSSNPNNTSTGMSAAFGSFFKNYAARRRAQLLKKLQLRSNSNDVNSTVDPATRMIWIDMELTGLDLEKDVIMEIACVVTEENLKIIAQAPPFIIHQPKEVLSNMGSWCQQQHSKTGLIDECLRSNTTLEEADQQLLNFVKQYVPEGKGCVAGNSVYMDKWFVMKYLPNLNKHLHYRLIDVSSLKELCRKWRQEDYKKVPNKAYVHRALDDVLESINELKYYKKIFFDRK